MHVKPHSETSEPRRHTIEMYSSAAIAFTPLYTHDLDLWHLTLNISSAIHTHMMIFVASFIEMHALSIDSVMRN